MIRPTISEAKSILGDYKVFPVSCEILSDVKTPIEVLKILKNKSKHCYMLESVENQEKWGRYTFLGFEPKLEIGCTNGVLSITSDKRQTIKTNNPQKYIRQILEQYKSPRFDYLPPFTGGLVGYFAYDYIKYSTKLNFDLTGQEGFGDFDLMLFDKVIAFDNLRQKIILIVNAKTENMEHEYDKAVRELKRMVDLIRHGEGAAIPKSKVKSQIKPQRSREEFCEIVERARHYIKEGDIFQVVLSNLFEADFEGSLFDTYRVLRSTNPSPYMFYFGSDHIEIAGASPETLVKLENGVLHTFPLAGTRKRGATEREDKMLEQELLNDEKEKSEHNMLVDLGRNDLGKICEFGSVKVEKHMSIQMLSHVMHIGSTVTGKIKNGKDALDAIDAVLPAGTLSGAPKLRACQIINELEKNSRGVYGGAIGYLDFTGNLDTCIAIRIAVKKNGKVFIRSGAGIVADSVAEKEYEECINKAKAVMDALKIAGGGEI